MSDTIKRVNVRIAGVAYQFTATEDESHIRKMAAQADEMIRQVLLAGPHLSQSMATILALVNAMDDINKNKSQAEALLQEKSALQQQVQKITTEYDRIREQNWEMRKDQLQLQRLIAEYEKRFEQILQAAEAQERQDLQQAAEEPKTDVAQQATVPLAYALESESDFDSLPTLAVAETEVIETLASPLTLTAYQQSRLEDYI